MNEEKRRYLEERWQSMMDRNAKKSGEAVTWDDCIRYAEEAFSELEVRMNTDIAHAVFWQQQMAVMMFWKQEFTILKHREESKG